MGRVPLPANSFWCEAGCRLMSATSIIGCECEPWPHVKGEDAASWIKDRGFRSANFTPIRQRAGKYISADWVYQKDFWGLWPFCKPNIEDVLSQSLSLLPDDAQKSGESVPYSQRSRSSNALGCALSFCVSEFWRDLSLSAISLHGPPLGAVKMAQGCGLSKSASSQCCVMRSLGGKWLETVPCAVCNLSARGDNNHRAVPKVLEQCYWLFPNSHLGIVSNIEMLRTLRFNDFLLFLLFSFSFSFSLCAHTERLEKKQTGFYMYLFSRKHPICC